MPIYAHKNWRYKNENFIPFKVVIYKTKCENVSADSAFTFTVST